MLAKKFRLNIAEFIKKRPTFVKKGPFFAVKTIPNELSYSRFGIVISKKIDKRAVGRNKLRRFFNENIRERKLPATPGYDVLIVIYPEIKQFSQEDVKKYLQEYSFLGN